ncbi:MAG: NADH-quinone oxidoreductase subunit G, partial [Pseudomonadota bacterium]|nr:NADH-quinone oxidoreductase subunit G [Pseudomonadota bacterium]
GMARENWAILRALSDILGVPLAFNSLDELRRQLFNDNPDAAAINEIPRNSWSPAKKFSKKCLDKKLRTVLKDHYLTNSITRSSVVMAQLSKNNMVINPRKEIEVS